MPIYYSEEKEGWALDQITEKETQLLVEMGQQYALQALGIAILKKYAQHEDAVLGAMPKEHMGQA